MGLLLNIILILSFAVYRSENCSVFLMYDEQYNFYLYHFCTKCLPALIIYSWPNNGKTAKYIGMNYWAWHRRTQNKFVFKGRPQWLHNIHCSPVDFKSNPEISCLNRQDKPLDRKFSTLYDGISCQFVGVEQFSQSKKL